MAIRLLCTASLEGYKFLSTAQSFGRDYGDLCYRLDIEKLYLKKWVDAWVLDQSSRQIHPSDPDYQFAIATLARVLAVFGELVVYSSYCDRPRKKRDVIPQRLRGLFRPLAISSPADEPSVNPPAEEPSVNPPGLDQDSIKLLTNPSLWNFEQTRPGLKEEVERLSYSAESLQKALSAGRKLQWSMIDKEKFENLITRLKEHNEYLNKILPVNTRGPFTPFLSSSCQAKLRLTLCKGGIRPATPSFTVTPRLPFDRNYVFCGRDDIIDTIHSILKGSAPHAVGEDARSTTRKTVVLHGLGGMGKSSIALEYSFRYLRLYTAVFWVDVTNGTSLSRSARGIAEHIVADHAKQGHSHENDASILELRDCLNPN